MRIVIDMQGAQTESRYRGIGRYTMAFAQAVVRNRGEHEVILALSGLFPDTIEPLRAAFDGLLPQENIRVWHAPGPVKDEDPSNSARREVAELVREAFLASLCPDVIHICSLFEGHVDDAVTSVGRLNTTSAVSVTVHDLIPLLSPDQYLRPNAQFAAYYHRKLDSLKKASMFLAISESSRREILTCLDVPEEVTVNTSEGVDAIFRPLTIPAEQADRLLRKMNVTLPFVLYTGGADERKNLPRLIEAWSKLPGAIRQTHQLLFAGRIPRGNIVDLRHIAERYGLNHHELLFSGYVSDEELVQLYNLCKLFVFPSWHEGFGLPALEAMACGTPVIGANSTSLPEVIGLTDALFDPFNITEIRDKLEHALSDDAFRQHLSEHSRFQARRFSWDKTAIHAISAWEHLTAGKRDDTSSWRYFYDCYTSMYRSLLDNLAEQSNLPSAELELRNLAACLSGNEQQIFEHLRRKELPREITWRIEGPFDSSYSLALVNREFARALARLGHKVVLHATEGPGDFNPDDTFLIRNPDLAEMHSLSKQVTGWQAEVTSRNLYPPRVTDMTSRLNSVHAYGWEESGFPLEWVETFNLSLQGMTVMSRHVHKIMVDHGVSIPMAVSSIGVDHWERVEPDASFRVHARSFRFLHVSSCFPRKGADVMLRAYGRSFRASDDVTLIIKTFSNPHNEIHRWLDEARQGNPDFPDVQIIETDLTDAQLKSLYEQCHALVAPSRAEGFGLPMAEAMLAGLAVITTAWSGQTDFCTPKTAWLIDYSFERATSHFGLFSSVWAEPDEAHLAHLMREVFESNETVRRARVEAGRRLLLDNFRWMHAATRIVDSARRWSIHTETPNPRVGWITTWNSKCGIATYSEHLIASVPREVSIFAAHADALTTADDERVTRCWHQGEEDSLGGLTEAIARKNVDIVVVQFNYGFFNFEVLSKFLAEQIEIGRKVVITLHSTTDPTHAPHKKLALLAPVLGRCDRILVHSRKDLNRLKSIDLVDNVTLFPHGVLNYEGIGVSKSRGDEGFVVASYGFFLPHKGLLELIEAIELLRERGMNVRLEMINAEYPVPESRLLIERARLESTRRGLSDYINLCTDFLPDRESLERLARSDLVIFPYQETGESASGAVRYGMASGRPVAVTPLAIFDDVAEATHRLPGTSPTEIAEGIYRVSEAIRLRSSTATQIEQAAQRWRSEHGYTQLGNRLNGMLVALMR